MKYRKQPVVIEAVQFNGTTNWDEAPEWLVEATQKPSNEINSLFVYPPNALIGTLEGPMTAAPGDYIIRGVKGEIYSCREDIFLATYEAAE